MATVLDSQRYAIVWVQGSYEAVFILPNYFVIILILEKNPVFKKYLALSQV